MKMFKVILKITGILVVCFILFEYGAEVVKHGDSYEVSEKPGITGPDTGTKGKKNINAVTENDIIVLYGFGEKLAEKIVEYIKSSGGIRGMEELYDIQGIGEKRYKVLRESFDLQRKGN